MENLKVTLDFFIIGAAKSGTTWLSKNLSKHSSIFIPEEKELGYFCEKNYLYPLQENPLYLSNNKRVESYFNGATSKQLLGEGTTSYLWDSKAPKNLFHHNKNAKIIAILRNPVERLISHYRYWLQLGVIANQNILDTIKERPEMLELGNYSTQLIRYYDLFPNKQILILLFDDLLTNSNQILISTEEFLGVHKFIPDNMTQIVNKSEQARFWRINRMISKMKFFVREKGIDYDKISYISKKLGFGSPLNRFIQMNKSNNKRKIGVNHKVEQYLFEQYANEIPVLEKLIKRDLSKWSYQNSIMELNY